MLATEAAELHDDIGQLVQAIAPWLLELPGMGPISAGWVLVSRSHAGRLRSEAAFAALAGVSPIPASSGQVTRHGLNRGRDRQLNRALHTVALVRLRDDPTTRAHAARRRADGRSPREIRRCVKRAAARHLFKLLCRYDRPEVVRICPGRHTSAVAGGSQLRSCSACRVRSRSPCGGCWMRWGSPGFVHARAIDDDREVALDADASVVMASVFKVAVCLELFRQAADGEVDLAERTWFRRPAAVPARSGCR